jgi:aspartyl/asparaginyl-tRNA synthetase
MSTSYRDEPNPTPGRHADLAFPLIEWEEGGGIEKLIQTEKELLAYLGYDPSKFLVIDYGVACQRFGVTELENKHEEQLCKDFNTPTVFITNFPESTSPFFNMAMNPNGTARKIDVILDGIETFGSAERSCDVPMMKHLFATISEGDYRRRLYQLFGQERVDQELEQYFEHPMVPRCGGGIGLTRLIRSMQKQGLVE